MLEGENQVQWLRQREKRQTWISMLTGKKRHFMAQMIRQSIQAIVVKGETVEYQRSTLLKAPVRWYSWSLSIQKSHNRLKKFTVFINILPCSHFASLHPFSNSEWKFPGKPFLWMECMRFVPGEKKKRKNPQGTTTKTFFPWNIAMGSL